MRNVRAIRWNYPNTPSDEATSQAVLRQQVLTGAPNVNRCNTITLVSLGHDVIHAGGVGDDSLKCGGTSREEEGGGDGRHDAKSSKVAKTDMVRKVMHV